MPPLKCVCYWCGIMFEKTRKSDIVETTDELGKASFIAQLFEQLNRDV